MGHKLHEKRLSSDENVKKGWKRFVAKNTNSFFLAKSPQKVRKIRKLVNIVERYFEKTILDNLVR